MNLGKKIRLEDLEQILHLQSTAPKNTKCIFQVVTISHIGHLAPVKFFFRKKSIILILE